MLATLLFGLVIGLAVGIVIGRRQGADAAPRPPVASTLLSTAVVPSTTTATAPGLAPVDMPNKKAQKAGITPADFQPSDDILHRMQHAWEQAEQVEGIPAVIDRIEDPALTEQMRRVFEQLNPDLVGEGGATMTPDSKQPESQEPETPSPVAAPSAGTVTEGVAALESEGYGDDLRFDAGRVVCKCCGEAHDTTAVEVDVVLRFEGPSDPADEAMVLGLRCPNCGAKGALVSAFGPDADPELADAFVYLASRARHR